METYREMQNRHQTRFDILPKIFSFNDQQWEQGKKELGVVDDSELFSIGYGGWMRKTDRQLYYDACEQNQKEREEARKDYNFCVDMFQYELANHEYCETFDDEETFNACGLTRSEVDASETLTRAFQIARKKYLAGHGINLED